MIRIDGSMPAPAMDQKKSPDRRSPVSGLCVSDPEEEVKGDRRRLRACPYECRVVFRVAGRYRIAGYRRWMDGALGCDFRPRMAPLLGRYAADEELVLRMLAAGPAMTMLKSAGCFFDPTTRCVTRFAASR